VAGREQVPAPVATPSIEADDARWFGRLDAVVDHHARTGRWPATSSHDGTTTQLGRWLSKTRSAYRQGTLAPVRAERLERSGVPLRPTGAHPRLGAAVRAEQIRPLAAAGLTTDQIAEQIGLSAYQVRAIIRRYDLPRPPGRPTRRGWASANDARWFEWLDAVVDHHARTGRWPAATSPDGTTAQLGRWLSKTRSAYRQGTLAPVRAERLERSGVPLRHPRYDLPTVRAELIRPLAAAGLTTAQIAEQIGLSAGYVLNLIARYDLRNGRGTGGAPADDARWFEWLDAVVDHHARTGRWPAADSTDRTTAQLGRWLRNARYFYRHGALAPVRAERLERSGVLLRPTGAHPRLGAAVRAEQIRPLAAAGLTTDQIAEQIGLSVQRVRRIIARGDLPSPRCAGGASANDARWFERLDAVVDHHARTGRWPASTSPDRTTAQLGRWLRNALYDYRRGTLLAPVRAERLERSGVLLRPRVEATERAGQIRPLAAAGLTTDQIAEQIGLSAGYVLNLIARYDLPRPPVRRPRGTGRAS